MTVLYAISLAIACPMLRAVIGDSSVPRYHHPSARIFSAALVSARRTSARSLSVKSSDTRSRPVPTHDIARPSRRR